MPTKVRPKKPKLTAPPVSPPPVVTSPPPVTMPAKLGSFGNASIDQWDGAFLAAVAALKRKKGITVDPRFLKAMMAVESGNDGNYPPGRCRSDGSCGPMQIKPQYHQHRCPECDFKTVPGQIELAAHIIGDTMKAKGLDEYGALLDTYFPGTDVQNGTTQQQYVARVKDLIARMGGTSPPPPPPEPPPVDVIDAIVGGAPYTDDYGFKAPTDLPYYAYFEGHGGHPNQHTGIDVTGPIGETLYSPISGTVVCAGTGVGQGAYGSSCAAFEYTLGAKTGSSGRFEILHDDGRRSLILGHVLRSLVRVGEHVSPGQPVAELGGQNGPHIHVEARIWQNGNYTIVDPRQAFGGGTSYPGTVDIPQPDDTPPYVVVKAIRPTQARQRASKDSPAVFDAMEAGETFFAQHQVIGADGTWWYVGRGKGRVPRDDCEEVEVTT